MSRQKFATAFICLIETNPVVQPSSVATRNKTATFPSTPPGRLLLCTSASTFLLESSAGGDRDDRKQENNAMTHSPDVLQPNVLCVDEFPRPVQIVPAYPGRQLLHLGAAVAVHLSTERGAPFSENPLHVSSRPKETFY